LIPKTITHPTYGTFTLSNSDWGRTWASGGASLIPKTVTHTGSVPSNKPEMCFIPVLFATGGCTGYSG
ncbi:MAG: hypothetical protein IJ877_04025, partial [Candidatus Gastranaerophilales bacterium]|nr:hypothetical protein [Candidatus Gastranaerophilales bacterium]